MLDWRYYLLSMIIIYYSCYVSALNPENSEKNVCNRNFYLSPLCIDKSNSYKCKCNSGYIWNGEMCVATALNSYFEFVDKSTSQFILLEKTFPKLSSFTISTWVQIYNYSMLTSSSLLNIDISDFRNTKDFRTLFTYSLENFINVLRCQVSSTIIAKDKNAKKISINLQILINIFNSICNFTIDHFYNKSYWIHLTFTWNSSLGQMDVYINGKYRYNCSNMAKNKQISTAGVFGLGQSHKDNLFVKQSHLTNFTTYSDSATAKNDVNNNYDEITFDLNDPNHKDMIDDEQALLEKEQKNSKYEANLSFLGRLFNFNIWNHVKSSKMIQNLYLDCKLTYCGNAVQWSDFRQGTGGQAKLMWQTEFMMNRECLSKDLQQKTCNIYCNRENGPVCREIIEKNMRWPLAKANTTTKLKCLSTNLFSSNDLNSNTNNTTQKYAFRTCNIDQKSNFDNSSSLNGNNNGYYNHQLTASWQQINNNECVGEEFRKLKQELYIFHTTDNFDESKIFIYLEEMYDLCYKFIKFNPDRSIHDVSVLFDSLFYIINSQHQIIKRNLDIKFNQGYPDYDDTLKFTKYVLAIVDMLLSLSNDQFWNYSFPIGSESYRIVELVKYLSITLYDYQRLQLNDDYNYDDYNLYNYRKMRNANTNNNNNKNLDYFNNNNNNNISIDYNFIRTLPSYAFIEVKYQYIIFNQLLLDGQNQPQLDFLFPDRHLLIKFNDQTKSISKEQQSSNENKKDANRKDIKNTKQKEKLSNIKKTTNYGSFNSRKQTKMTQPTKNNIDESMFDADYMTTTISSLNKVDRYHFSSSYSPLSSSFSSSSSSNSESLTSSLPPSYYGSILFNENKLLTKDKNKNPFALLTVIYSGLEHLLPNHNRTFRPKDNNINSVVVTTEIIGVNGPLKLNEFNINKTLSKPINLFFTYFNNFNISDTRCVYLEEANHSTSSLSKTRFKWARNYCRLKQNNSVSASCECFSLGTYSITNDLYDPLWSPKIVENIPLLLPSYFGCTVVSLFCVATLLSLIYLRTKSATASIHKNLCISICLSQLIIMISLSKFNYDRTICNVFGILNHYMFFVVFAWLMNEAFNLYITITYAAHQSHPMNDTGSQWRFYLLGYLFPAVLVIVLFLTKSNEYYDKKLCWFNLEYLWINVSPMISMLAVSCLVMVFSAKEQTETSYTKNEKSNKLIANHTKAVWTQIVLLSLCWTFGIMSFMFIGEVPKYLYAFLNCLQGSFLFIFYFLLNEEVRKYMRDKKKKKRLKLKQDLNNLSNNVQDLVDINKDDNIDDDDEDEEDESDQEQKDKNNISKENSFNSKKINSYNYNNDNYSEIRSKQIDDFTINNNNNSNNNNPNEYLDFSLSNTREIYLTKKNSTQSGGSITKSVKFESNQNKCAQQQTANLVNTNSNLNNANDGYNIIPSQSNATSNINSNNSSNFSYNQSNLNSLSSKSNKQNNLNLDYQQQLPPAGRVLFCDDNDNNFDLSRQSSRKRLSFKKQNLVRTYTGSGNGASDLVVDTTEQKVTVL